MKTNLLSTLLIAIFILANCSGDRVVVDRIHNGTDFGNSTNMTEAPQPQYPPEYGDDEFRPPFMIMVSYNCIPDTIGSFCQVLVGAELMDFYARPYCAPGIEVNFEVIPDSLADINNAAYTDEWGCVLAKLVYPAYYALEEVQLAVSCFSTADTFTMTLPLFPGNLDLHANPQRLWIVQPGEYDTSSIACRLTDGLGYGIDNGRIFFTALVAGEICGPTSSYTDNHGWAYTHYRIRFEDIPDGSSDPNFIETGVRATLFGYPDAETEVILLCARP